MQRTPDYPGDEVVRRFLEMRVPGGSGEPNWLQKITGKQYQNEFQAMRLMWDRINLDPIVRDWFHHFAQAEPAYEAQIFQGEDAIVADKLGEVKIETDNGPAETHQYKSPEYVAMKTRSQKWLDRKKKSHERLKSLTKLLAKVNRQIDSYSTFTLARLQKDPSVPEEFNPQDPPVLDDPGQGSDWSELDLDSNEPPVAGLKTDSKKKKVDADGNPIKKKKKTEQEAGEFDVMAFKGPKEELTEKLQTMNLESKNASVESLKRIAKRLGLKLKGKKEDVVGRIFAKWQDANQQAAPQSDASSSFASPFEAVYSKLGIMKSKLRARLPQGESHAGTMAQRADIFSDSTSLALRELDHPQAAPAAGVAVAALAPFESLFLKIDGLKFKLRNKMGEIDKDSGIANQADTFAQSIQSSLRQL